MLAIAEQANPEIVRQIAGLERGQIDHSNSTRLMPRYIAAKAVVESGGECLSITDGEICGHCTPERRMCELVREMNAEAAVDLPQPAKQTCAEMGWSNGMFPVG